MTTVPTQDVQFEPYVRSCITVEVDGKHRFYNFAKSHDDISIHLYGGTNAVEHSRASTHVSLSCVVPLLSPAEQGLLYRLGNRARGTEESTIELQAEEVCALCRLQVLQARARKELEMVLCSSQTLEPQHETA